MTEVDSPLRVGVWLLVELQLLVHWSGSRVVELGWEVRGRGQVVRSQWEC